MLASRLPIFGANADPRFVDGTAGCLIGMFQLSPLLLSGVLGFLIPKGIAEVVPWDHVNLLYGPTYLDALGRLELFIGLWLGTSRSRARSRFNLKRSVRRRPRGIDGRRWAIRSSLCRKECEWRERGAHPSLTHPDEARQTRITVNGIICEVPAGRNVAAALLAVGIRKLRESARASEPRGAFCMMGVCQECVVHINGHLRQACMVPVTPGLSIILGAGTLGGGAT